MFCHVQSAMLLGVEAVPVTVEADVSDGMPQFTMVGLVSSQVREAQERVRTALRNVDIPLPPQRITINMAPGDLRKDGTRFDLPIAAAVLLALAKIPEAPLAGAMLVGELHLDGSVGAVPGVLPTVLLARKSRLQTCVVPVENLAEARAAAGELCIVGVRSLQDFLDWCAGKEVPEEIGQSEMAEKEQAEDFSDIHGQASVKRASLIAAAGFHNLLLSGPPGSGKSMAARRIPTILPRLTEEESLEISKIYSIVGLLSGERPMMRSRPFRAPHHTITAAALCGSGLHPKPGEITLAHRGVLFLDELPEMRSYTIELLRQPLEDRVITVSRAGGSYTYPASFLLVAAMNPCPCGYYPDRNRCACTPREVQRYQDRVSQALLDRIDLRCDVPAARYEELTSRKEEALSSKTMRQQVEKAYQIQKERYRNSRTVFNSELRTADLDRYCPRTKEAEQLLKAAFEKMGLSARGYHRVLRVARTLADLDEEEKLHSAHISEALCFRSGEKETLTNTSGGVSL